MFEERAILLRKKEKAFERQKERLTPEASNKEFKRLQELRKQIQEIRIFPRYMGYGVILTFVLYMFSAFVSGGWLCNPVNRTSEAEFVIQILFGAAIAVFLLLGIVTIIDVNATMKKEYERIKEELKQTS